MPEDTKFPEDATISLNAMFGLSDALSPYVDAEDRIGVLWVVLGWCANQGFLTPRPEMRRNFVSMPFLAHAVWPEPPEEGVAEDNPAGPQASSVKPDPKAAGDLNAVADRTECEVEAPMGAEGVVLSPDDAPATPVAGGVAPQLQPTRWTDEEDERAIAMKLAGHSAGVIAAALGRPEQGTSFRLKTKLKDRIDAARKAARNEQAEGPKEGGAESGGDCSGLKSGEGPREAAAPEESEEEAKPQDRPVAAADIPAPAPPFDPSRPGWWRTANANLSTLGYRRPFTARGDLQLVEDLLKGMKIDVVAADMLISAVELKNRWRALLSAVGTPDGKQPTIEEQAHLLEILRARAAEKSLKAAE